MLATNILFENHIQPVIFAMQIAFVLVQIKILEEEFSTSDSQNLFHMKHWKMNAHKHVLFYNFKKPFHEKR